MDNMVFDKAVEPVDGVLDVLEIKVADLVNVEVLAEECNELVEDNTYSTLCV